MRTPTALLTAVLLACCVSAFAQKADAPKAAPAAPAAAKPAPAPAAEPIDINSADAKTLMTLKGVGDATADKIIKGRPYGGKDDLVKKKIVTDKVYGDIKEQIIAKKAVAKEAPKKDEKKK